MKYIRIRFKRLKTWSSGGSLWM